MYLGTIELLEGQWEEAEGQLRRALDSATRSEDFQTVQQTTFSLADLDLRRAWHIETAVLSPSIKKHG